MTDQRPAHHPVLDALLDAKLSDDDLYILGSAVLAAIGKSAVPGRVPPWGQQERWFATELRKSLRYFATGIDPDDKETWPKGYKGDK